MIYQVQEYLFYKESSTKAVAHFERGNGHISANKLEFAVVFHLGAERAYTFWPFLASNATIAQELGDESLHCGLKEVS